MTIYDELYDVLSEYNAKFNLTAIREKSDFMTKHVADCTEAGKIILASAPDASSLLDVGSGAGFPAIPLAIECPAVTVTALDSTAKKTAYIAAAAERLSLTNIRTLTGRAEEIISNDGLREHFDIVTARAVSRLNVLIELCAPFVKVGGIFAAMKGAMAAEEAAEAQKAAPILGLSTAEIIPYSLPDTPDSRAVVLYRKVSPTPDRYPRQYAKIVKKPL